MKGHHTPHTEATKLKISLSKLGCVSPRKGIKLTQETKDKISKAKKGISTWNKGGVAYWMIGNTNGKGKVAWNKGKKFLQVTGEKNSNWKGGVTKNTVCLDCGNSISWGALRCSDCFYKAHKGENHQHWKGGITPMYRRLRVERIKKNGGSHTLEQWDELKKFYNYICLCCKKSEPFIKLTEDHIIPISKGGSDNIENIQPLCQSCNSIKMVKIFDYRIPLLVTYSE